MRSGTLRRRVTFQTQSATVDAHGEPVDTWTDAFTVWASVEDLSSKEALRDTAFTASITTKLTLRYRDDITVGQRVDDRGRILEVAAPPIDVEGRGREITLLCKEVAP